MRFRRRWQRAPGPRFWPQRRRGPWFALRPFLLAGVLGLAWAGADPMLVDPPGLLSTDPERVSETFTRCGPGRGHACVIDGDTFKLGQRKIRIIGIDAPETHPARCAEEARLGEQATAKLQQLLNQGPFEMVAPIYGSKDRTAATCARSAASWPDGSTQSIADAMRDSGLAHRYGGFKSGWC